MLFYLPLIVSGGEQAAVSCGAGRNEVPIDVDDLDEGEGQQRSIPGSMHKELPSVGGLAKSLQSDIVEELGAIVSEACIKGNF